MLKIKSTYRISPTLYAKLQKQGAIQISSIPKFASDDHTVKEYIIVVHATNADGSETDDVDCPRPCPEVDDDGKDDGSGG